MLLDIVGGDKVAHRRIGDVVTYHGYVGSLRTRMFRQRGPGFESRFSVIFPAARQGQVLIL